MRAWHPFLRQQGADVAEWCTEAAVPCLALRLAPALPLLLSQAAVRPLEKKGGAAGC